MNANLARTLSWLLHPSLMPTFFIALFFHYSPLVAFILPVAYQIMVFCIVFFFTFLMPGITVYTMQKTGQVESLLLRTAAERRLPFWITTFYYFAAYYVMKEVRLPALFSLTMLGAAISVGLAAIINHFWKISIHMIGIGGVCGALLGMGRFIDADVTYPFVFFVLLSGLLAGARLERNAHDTPQLLAGYLVGFFSIFAVLVFA